MKPIKTGKHEKREKSVSLEILLFVCLFVYLKELGQTGLSYLVSQE